jgi:wyosine [tRNA(Phe)-imidazoG37] synthetase (radical SAM superfamily)
MSYKHLYGPVNSRRLGISLGVDCVKAKTCNLDCIYCECGATTNLTMGRMEYVPADEIISELTDFLKEKPRLDYISFGGSGEPTLNSGIGRILRFLKQNFSDYKTALLTNGALLYMPEVRNDILSFDCVLPSFDAASDEVFKLINRPHADLKVDMLVEGMAAFSRQYKGALWMEVFIIPGVNDSPEELKLFKEKISQINPTRVQLNSLDRPGTCKNIKPASSERLNEIATFLSPLPVEIISRSANIGMPQKSSKHAEELLISTIRRRPLTIEDVSSLLGITINRCSDMLETLVKSKNVGIKVVDGRTFYVK